MSQMSRAAMKWRRLIEASQLNIRPPSTFLASPKLFSTEAVEPSLESSVDQFLRMPSSGSVYAKLGSITRHTTKSDIINHLEGCELNVGNLKVEYNKSYAPMSMIVDFPSRSIYDAAIRAINRKGRLYKILRADKSEWDYIHAPYDGKAILLFGIPRNALIDDIERFLSGCQYYSSSIEIFSRITNQGLVRMAIVRFPSQALAMHSYITKNRGYCLNDQVKVSGPKPNGVTRSSILPAIPRVSPLRVGKVTSALLSGAWCFFGFPIDFIHDSYCPTQFLLKMLLLLIEMHRAKASTEHRAVGSLAVI